MEINHLTKFWPLIYSIVREYWEIIEPGIEDAAVKNDIPIELYFYSELGLETFSLEDFQKRDPFTNPEQFERAFARFDVKGWIVPIPDEKYEVTDNARDGVRLIIQTGDTQLANFDQMPDDELKELETLLKKIVAANLEAPEPPEKWAIIKRFHVADGQSPLMVRIRELLMDFFAYRDDSHLSAAHTHFGQAGIVWSVLDSIWNGDALTAEQMMDTMSFRGYAVEDYQVAIQAAVKIGWIEPADVPGMYRLTERGKEILEQVEKLTNEYFYRPWSKLSHDEIDRLYELLTKLHEGLSVYKKSLATDSHF